jgi:cytoskeletal protein CcmA (bactofilin family)
MWKKENGNGRVEGKVISQGTLVVGESAILDAEIDAGTVVSGGTINGNIIATHKVHLLPSAVQTGYIRAPILIIEEGASFNGNCEMGKVGEPLEAAVKFRES